MNRGLKIVGLIMLYLLACGKSCQDDQDIVNRQLKEVELARENVRETFDVDYLSEELKYATELTALQNLNDLADYVGIFADAGNDPVFRQKAAAMIRDLFQSENTLLSFGPLRNGKFTYVSLEKFFKKGFGQEVRSAEMAFDHTAIGVPLGRSGAEAYEAMIFATQKLTLHTLSDSSLFLETLVSIPIRARQEHKIFGSDTIKTWTVRFGDMHTAD